MSPISMKWDKNTLIALRDQDEKWLLQQPGIYGTAIGEDDDGRLSLKIFVETNAITESEMRIISDRLGDVPVSFVEIPPLIQRG